MPTANTNDWMQLDLDGLTTITQPTTASKTLETINDSIHKSSKSFSYSETTILD